MNRAAKFVVIIIAAVLVVEMATYIYRWTHEREIAFQMVLEDCKQHGYDAPLLRGPTDGDVGNATVSFSWDYHDPSHHYEYLVSFNRLYLPGLEKWDYDRKD
jgi:hypothetical protein